MKKSFILLIPFIFFILFMNREAVTAVPIETVPQGAVNAPVLKWQRGGCYASWCETGWYSSPAVADLDGDNKPEVIGSPYTLFTLNGEDGTVQWSVDPPGERSWPGIVVSDIDNNNDLEVLVAKENGYITVYDHLGNQVWSQRPKTNELRGISVYDLDADNTMEIAVTVAGNDLNTWVYEHNGATRAGWPQLSNDSGYAWGVYNDNAALGDLDNDGLGELVIPSDVHYINAYEANGAQIAANSMYGNKGWGAVGIWESLATELEGWGRCNGDRAQSYRTNFADGPAVIVDVDGDGSQEVVVTGKVYDCNAGKPPSRYVGVYIFNADRSRYKTGSYNWETVPVDTGAPLSEDWRVIQSATYNPVVVDLDGDGEKEILFSSYDGRLHAFWLDKTEHHSWPFNVTNTGPGIRFATEPAIADLDNDGKAEVIFASWPENGNNYVGKLHILNYQGQTLHEVSLPAPHGDDWNGALAAPTLDNIDADNDLEVVLNTTSSGIIAYDLPGTSNARVIWRTGRNNYQRTGSYLVGSLQGSAMRMTPTTPGPGDTAVISFELKNPGPTLDSASLTHNVPANVTYAGSLSASTGSANHNAGVITWNGAVEKGTAVTISYDVTINGDVTDPTVITGSATANDGLGNDYALNSLIIANGTNTYLPIVRK